MSVQSANLSGMTDVLALLDKLGTRGDGIARSAATTAARTLRASYLVGALSRESGIKQSVVLRNMVAKPADKKYPAARVNFSGAGILVKDYSYRQRVVGGAGGTRAQILVDWVGGTKVAAGFINARSQRKAALSTRNSKTTRRGKTYTYRQGKLMDAMGPSLATLYQALPEGRVSSEAQETLSAALNELLDEVFND